MIDKPEQMSKYEMHRNGPLDIIREMNISPICVKDIVEQPMNYQDQKAANGSEVRLCRVR
jgi:hypothetical protein